LSRDRSSSGRCPTEGFLDRTIFAIRSDPSGMWRGEQMVYHCSTFDFHRHLCILISQWRSFGHITISASDSVRISPMDSQLSSIFALIRREFLRLLRRRILTALVLRHPARSESTGPRLNQTSFTMCIGRQRKSRGMAGTSRQFKGLRIVPLAG
jgi:hypothetical protein